MRLSTWWVVVLACFVGAMVVRVTVPRIWTTPLPTKSDSLRGELPGDSLDAVHHPTSFRPQQRLADVLLRLGRAVDAEVPARRAVALAPRQASAHATLGEVLASELKFAPAIDELTDAMRRGAHDRMTYGALAWSYVMTRQDSAASRTYTEALSRGYDDPTLLSGYAMFLISKGRPNAMAYAEHVVALAPNWAPAHAILSKAFAARSDAHHAREHMQRATELYPGFWGYWADLGDYAFLDGDTAAAWSAFSRARALDSARFDAMPSWHAMWTTANAAHR
jgi:Tfp pilus assembly protein PilF